MFLFSVPSPYEHHAPRLGRPIRIDPVFIRYTDSGCVTLSPWQPRKRQMSSTHSATCGNQSDTSIPDLPCFLKVRLLARSLFLSTPRRVLTGPNDSGSFRPC